MANRQKTAKWSQSAILTKLGFPKSAYWELNGNGKLMQTLNTEASLKGLPEPFNPSLASTIIQDVLPLAALAGGAAIPGEEGAATAAGGASGAGAAGGISAGTAAGGGAAILGAAAAIGSVTDFLSFIAWIFHPLNILRAVEFVAGGILMAAGLRTYVGGGSSNGAGIARITRELGAASPLGQVSRERQGRKMGRREGQREAARMGARREATRSERTVAAHERERINVTARTVARTQKAGMAKSRATRGKGISNKP